MILPAIDIIGGECVRLAQGDYEKKQTYSKNPADIARKFEQSGSTFLHIVDLDGAASGSSQNLAQVQNILENTDLSVQVGGGIRNFEAAKRLFDLGVDRIILGTSAVNDKILLKKLLKQYGAQKIMVSVDARDEKVLTEGWLKDSSKFLSEFLEELKGIGIKTIIFTDINSDGMLKGPNWSNIKQVIAAGLNVIVAGGISSSSDLQKLKEIGAYGAIIGKALYEGMIDLTEAVEKFQLSNLTKRIIPCMDIKDGRVVKGTFFTDLKDAGDPVELAKKYSDLGADELVFLDITATVEKRKTLCELVKKIAENINIPFTVGGGINSIADIRDLLNSGADKVSIGSAAVRNPELVKKTAKAFGSQCVVISVDAKRFGDSWNIFIDGGCTNTGLDVLNFVREMEKLGAGELLVNSLDRDGTKQGYDTELLRAICCAVSIPVIASSGAGAKKDFLDAFNQANVDAVLAASVFHYGQIEIFDLKKYLQANLITMRPEKKDLSKLDFSKLNGLVPAIVQDADTLQVLMLGFMNRDAFEKTLTDGKVTFFSRSKNRLWQKGESSGNFLKVIEVKSDCDSDSLLILAKPEGPTCHTGTESCFGKSEFDLIQLFELIKERKKKMPENSYTSSLFSDGLDKIIAKIEEEAEEVARAAKSEGKQRLIEESCDLLYHLFVLLNNEDVTIADIQEELEKRHK